MDGYRAYTNFPARWADPDANFGPNESFYQNDIERSDYVTNDDIHKTDEFNGTNEKNNIAAYNMASVSSYLFVPFYGTMQPNAATSSRIIWHQQTKRDCQIRGFLSSDATPFIPSKPETSKNFAFTVCKYPFFKLKRQTMTNRRIFG